MLARTFARSRIVAVRRYGAINLGTSGSEERKQLPVMCDAWHEFDVHRRKCVQQMLT